MGCASMVVVLEEEACLEEEGILRVGEGEMERVGGRLVGCVCDGWSMSEDEVL